MTYLDHTSFEEQKKISEKHLAFKDKSGDIKKVVIVRRRLVETLYARQYSTNFSVYYDSVDPTVIGYEPADLTVHPPPPRTAEGGFIFFV